MWHSKKKNWGFSKEPLCQEIGEKIGALFVVEEIGEVLQWQVTMMMTVTPPRSFSQITVIS